jgi:hypothetical protein
MRLKKTLVVLALVGSTALTGCAGSNTDLKRGETNCDSDGTNSHDKACTPDSTPTPANNT